MRGTDAPPRLAAWRAHSAPIIPVLKRWLEAELWRTPRKPQLAEDICYTLAHWPGFIYLPDEGALELDINPVENLVRPIPLTRKNVLTAGNEVAAKN